MQHSEAQLRKFHANKRPFMYGSIQHLANGIKGQNRCKRQNRAALSHRASKCVKALVGPPLRTIHDAELKLDLKKPASNPIIPTFSITARMSDHSRWSKALLTSSLIKMYSPPEVLVRKRHRLICFFLEEHSGSHGNKVRELFFLNAQGNALMKFRV